jgi:hypothetical protein
MQLTPEQIDQIAKTFGLERKGEVLPVRDGFVTPETEVWWRGGKGPKQVIAQRDWHNITAFPSFYQLAEPIVRHCVYED